MGRVFIGDVHGKFTQYKKLLKQSRDSIQVGDMGVGFIKKWEDLGDGSGRLKLTSPPFNHMRDSGATFIRGNHDNPWACKKHPLYVPDGTVKDNMMFVGGALSIDKDQRTLDMDYWDDEELSIPELHRMMDVYAVAKPDVMVSHDCPEQIVPTVAILCNYETKKQFASRTRQAFDAFLDIHIPKIWVFGHWHQPTDIQYKGCRFIGLGELEAREVEVPA